MTLVPLPLLPLLPLARRSKYRLDCVVRTTLSGDDTSYNCVMEMEDGVGHRGVKLSKDLMQIAGACGSSCAMQLCTSARHGTAPAHLRA